VLTRIRTLLGKRSHSPVHDAAGNDQRKISQIGRNVQREAVRGDTARNMNADRGQLALGNPASRRRFRPHAGAPRNALRADAALAGGADQRLFQPTHIIHHAKPLARRVPVLPQVEDGIADKLPRSVVRHIAAALDDMQRNAPRGKLLVRGDNVFAPRIASQGKHRRVLQEQQRIADGAGTAQLNEAVLQGECAVVGHAPEFEKEEHGSVVMLPARNPSPSFPEDSTLVVKTPNSEESLLD
jgi:hypothetical protein